MGVDMTKQVELAQWMRDRERVERERDEAYTKGYAQGVEDAAKCYSPDDTATDWLDKILDLREKKHD